MRRLTPATSALFAILFALALAVPTVARAHPLVDRGRTQAVDADFEAALATFAAAEARDDLSRADLVRLLESRAYVHFATGDHRALENDVAMLAALSPSHRFDVSIPPEVRELHALAAEAAGERLHLEVEALELASGVVEVRALAVGDPGGLVGRVRVFVREAGGPWAEGGGGVRLPAPTGARVEWYAEAVGPGGAIVANQGTADDPERLGRSGSDTSSGSLGEEDGGVPLWVWVTAGAGAVLLGVLAVVLLSGGALTDDTQPSGPVLTMP